MSANSFTNKYFVETILQTNSGDLPLHIIYYWYWIFVMAVIVFRDALALADYWLADNRRLTIGGLSSYTD